MHHLPSRYIPCDGRLTASTYFNPHSPQGERPGGAVFVCTRFQSTLPAWGATIPIASKIWPLVISIHAPRRGSDIALLYCLYNGINFNPRSPHGERQASGKSPVTRTLFQSTLPAGGATHYHTFLCGKGRFPRRGSDNIILHSISRLNISIHAPRMGSDISASRLTYTSSYFNPRSPHGERRLLAIRRLSFE